ncbi:HU family DNA-binding protein [Xanthomonas arboricola]|uniref:HU family DNA-binding protein n=1 Tax=Xanthomonas arboricola TaxID=56448 RepID=UPI0017B876FD|nr:HU family DNA-binding protein [Xanthomonas arboricola]
MATKKSAKPVAKTPTAKAAPATIKPIKESFTKSALIKHLAEQTDTETKTVKAVLAALENTVLGSLSKRGIGEFSLPGLAKFQAHKVPAKPKRKGINPFTKEEVVFAAKPATLKVKVRPLKKLKDAAL